MEEIKWKYLYIGLVVWLIVMMVLMLIFKESFS